MSISRRTFVASGRAFSSIAQPLHDLAMRFWPCREPDFRHLMKG